ncbi:MAG: diacylglycerol kinase family lipid kinase [Chitinophagales bacterium]|nr:diacylglycerol kinase family lipid kinase [Chitinophagales bacterium]
MNQTKYFITVNPQSGAGKCGKDWALIENKLKQAGFDFEVQFSTQHRENISHVAEAIKQGYRKIIAVGGDGTLHHVANGILNQTEVNSQDIEVGFISVGTGNDWVKHFDIPTDYDQAIAIIKQGKTFLQDAGKLVYENGKQTEYFINFAGIGYDAYVVEHTADLKKYGQVAYLFGMVQCLFKYEAQKLQIEIDGKPYLHEDIFMLVAGLGKFAGGGMKLSKNAVIDDGLFDVTIGKNLGKGEIVMLTPKLFDGSYNEHTKVETLRCKQLKIRAENQDIVKAETDGEIIGTGAFELSVLPKAFKIYVP